MSDAVPSFWGTVVSNHNKVPDLAEFTFQYGKSDKNLINPYRNPQAIKR